MPGVNKYSLDHDFQGGSIITDTGPVPADLVVERIDASPP